MANIENIEIKIFLKQDLFSLLVQLLTISIIYIFIQLIIYKTVFVKLYNKYLNTYLNIIAIDLKINIIKKLDGDDLFDKELALIIQNNIDNDGEIEGKIIQKMNKYDVSNETIIKYITIYMLLKYLYSYNKDKNTYLLFYNYFIKQEGKDFKLPRELNIDNNNITTFYSLIPNKHRKTAISYFKFNDIKNIIDIENAEKIRQGVNSNINQINTYIAEANSYLDDDNFIINLGWYILINIILGTIYISIIVMIVLKNIGNTNTFDFNEFITFQN